MSKLPLANLPVSHAPADAYERRLNVKLNELYEKIRKEINKDDGWKDLMASVSNATVPASSAPVSTSFGPSGTRKEFAFAINDYIFIEPLHVNHDVKVNGKGYLHVHWTTNGTNTNTVKWSFEVMRALGHNQAAFAAPVTITVEQAASGTAWKHMIAEIATSDALTLTEPDELIIVTLKRVTNGGTNNTDTVFALEVDLHYESDRGATPQKSPDFYV